MNINLENAKNASVTCTVDGRFLHSKYNPENEAKSFVDSIDCDYSPSCVVVLGACLPYCIPYLKERFPNIPLYVIQFDSFFTQNDRVNMFLEKWDKTFLCTKETEIEGLSENLYSSLGEETLFAPLILEWKPSQNIFVSESNNTWQSLYMVIQKVRDVLATRSYFSLRWLKNIVTFCVHTKHVISVKKQDLPILLVASGETLQEMIPYIKEKKASFYILALSSALLTLVRNDIIPDLCIATDGGYYAQKHLDVLLRLNNNNKKVPLAISAESNIPKKILEEVPILPLQYNEGIDSMFLKECSFPAMPAERNGTVSGTAAMLALSLTDKKIYAVGLDLMFGKGYTHSQPHAHENIHSVHDFRLRPLSYRLFKSTVLNEHTKITSLDMYRHWFETRDCSFSKRFFRIASKTKPYKKTLGNIKDISWNDIEFTEGVKKAELYTQCTNIPTTDVIKKRISNLILREKKDPSPEWVEHCAPAEYLALKKYPHSSEYKKNYEKKLNQVFDAIERLYV